MICRKRSPGEAWGAMQAASLQASHQELRQFLEDLLAIVAIFVKLNLVPFELVSGHGPRLERPDRR